MTPLRVIGVASSAGAEAPGQEKAPQAMRDAGLVDLLTDAGIEVIDEGDIRPWRWRPDLKHRTMMNRDVVVGDAKAVEERVRSTLRAGQFPLVLGGGCSLELGTLAGHLPEHANIALLYFDLHPDLNVPGSVPAGSLDWMGTAHMLGEAGAYEGLSRMAPRYPLLERDSLLLFSYGPDQTTSWEKSIIEDRDLLRVTVDEVRADPEAAANRALQILEERHDRLMVHFDVDAIDFADAPLSENPGQNTGLPLDIAMRALHYVLQSEKLSALTITELNPDHGSEDGSTVRRFVEPLARALAAAPAVRA